MTALPTSQARVRVALAADWLAMAAAASLPWSTSATSLLVVLWLVALIPTLEADALRHVWTMPAAVLPVVLVAAAACGMAWADVTWPERLAGLAPFVKLLAVPLLLVQFRRSATGSMVLTVFLVSSGVLLAVSWSMFAVGYVRLGHDVGVPVKDYIIQSAEFAVCAFALADRAVASWRAADRIAVLWQAALAAAFVLNIVFVATARTTLVVIAVLCILFGLRHFNRVAFAAFLVIVAIGAGMAWTSSSYLRARVDHVAQDLETTDPSVDTSTGARLFFWRKSVEFIGEAPVIGHGTGTIAALFRRDSPDPAHASATNPHNQFFAVGIELGAVGIVLLIAMWAAHGRLFLGAGSAAWIGLVIVVQNVVGSLFNSHLFDFSHGWLYVFGVGVAGGMALKDAAGAKPTRATP